MEPTLQEGRTVAFLFEGAFTYWGSKNNEPIENVIIGFPLPNIENNIDDILVAPPGWALHYLDEENVFHLQMTNLCSPPTDDEPRGRKA